MKNLSLIVLLSLISAQAYAETRSDCFVLNPGYVVTQIAYPTTGSSACVFGQPNQLFQDCSGNSVSMNDEQIQTMSGKFGIQIQSGVLVNSSKAISDVVTKGQTNTLSIVTLKDGSMRMYDGETSLGKGGTCGND